MSDEAKWGAAGLVVGALVGGAVAYRLRLGAGDEDRPPIIVRGGSLRIQSGDDETGEIGKPWMYRRGWRSDHDAGFVVSHFFATVHVGGENRFHDRVKKVLVHYEGGVVFKFVIRRDENGVFVPMLKVRKGLLPEEEEGEEGGDESLHPALRYESAGSMTRVELFIGGEPTRYTNPTRIKLEPRRP